MMMSVRTPGAALTRPTRPAHEPRRQARQPGGQIDVELFQKQGSLLSLNRQNALTYIAIGHMEDEQPITLRYRQLLSDVSTYSPVRQLVESPDRQGLVQ